MNSYYTLLYIPFHYQLFLYATLTSKFRTWAYDSYLRHQTPLYDSMIFIKVEMISLED